MAKKKTTALARRAKPAPKKKAPAPLMRTRPRAVKAKEATTLRADLNARVLDDTIALGELGLFEVKLTEKEEAILNEPVPMAEIQIKPTASGAIYLSHPSYTRWFNRAFGRTGWALVPCSKPLVNDKSVVQPYILHIHGKPAAYAVGEQDYHANNKDQTYGDAIESTIASGLRRAAKRLGVGLEMWNRKFADDFLYRYGVKVWCDGKGSNEGGYKWRLKTDPPFYNEAQSRGRGEHREERPRERPPAQAERPAAHNPRAEEPITLDQVTRFWTIARRAGRSDDEVKRFLLQHYRLESTKAIKRKDYENILKAIEHPGTLLPVIDIHREREPGEDG